MIRELKKKPNLDAIEMVEELLVQLKSGEVTGVTLMIEKSDATYTTCGSSTMSSLQTAGILLEAAVRRVTHDPSILNQKG